MNLLSQAKLVLLILVMMFATLNDARADREPPRSLSEMDAASSLVVDGVVTAVSDLSTEELKHPNGIPVIRIRRQAVFQIEKIQKGMVGGNADVVYLEYWKVADSRYKGEVAPELTVNARFRLYADTVEVDQSGKHHVFVHTHNAVRPEALQATALVTPPPDKETAPDSQPPLPSGVLPSSPPKKAPEAKPAVPAPNEEPASSTPWSIIVGLIVAACGLLWLLLKSRS